MCRNNLQLFVSEWIPKYNIGVVGARSQMSATKGVFIHTASQDQFNIEHTFHLGSTEDN